MPKNYSIIGFARRKWNNLDFSNEMTNRYVKNHQSDSNIKDSAAWQDFMQHVDYLSSDFSNAQGYDLLEAKLNENDKEWGENSEKIFYLAVPPESYDTILINLTNSGLSKICRDNTSKLVIEKPFGHDAKSALALNTQVLKIFSEEQVYRIDHVLGKDPLMDIMSFRKYNYVLKNLLKKEHVDHIQISYTEEIGVADRGEFYERNGVIRDVIQNHILQILSVSTMAVSSDPTINIPLTEKKTIIESLRSISTTEIIAGQYQGYRSEHGVNSSSNTPTFVAIKTSLTSGDFRDVPIYIRAGKFLKQKTAEILFILKNEYPSLVELPNIIAFRIQPQEGVFMNFSKRNNENPDELESISLDFCYHNSNNKIKDAYEKLLLDLLSSQKNAFVHIDEVLASWDFIDPVNRMIEEDKVIKVHSYEKGTMGPIEADELLVRDGRKWYTDKFALACKI